MTVELRVRNPTSGRMQHVALFDSEDEAWEAVDSRAQPPRLPELGEREPLPPALEAVAKGFAPKSGAEYEATRKAFREHFEVGPPRPVRVYCSGNLAETFDEVDEATAHADAHASTRPVPRGIQALGPHAVAAHLAERRAAWRIVDTRPPAPPATSDDAEE